MDQHDAEERFFAWRISASHSTHARSSAARRGSIPSASTSSRRPSGRREHEPDGFPDELLGMVRALVQDRFKVRVHNEQRDAAIYALVLARPDGKTGASLHPVPDACAEAMKAMTERTPRSGPPPCSFGAGCRQADWDRRDADDVRERALGIRRPERGRSNRPQGKLRHSSSTFDPASAAKAPPGAPPGPTTADDTAPSIFTALQEQLGLKLESTRGQVDVLVIDSAERPTPN